MNMLSFTDAVQEEARQVVVVLEETAEKASEAIAATTPNTMDWSSMLWTALICICAVFFVLVLLIFVMKLFGVVFTQREKKEKTTASGQKIESGQIHEEEIAAIATALRLFNGELHDRESEVLTILNIKRAYSPWNSKIHGLTQLPDRKF